MSNSSTSTVGQAAPAAGGRENAAVPVPLRSGHGVSCAGSTGQLPVWLFAPFAAAVEEGLACRPYPSRTPEHAKNNASWHLVFGADETGEQTKIVAATYKRRLVEHGSFL